MQIVLPVREKDAHKGSCGRILIVAGSLGMTGAALLCTWAALRTGAGIVRLVLPKSLVPFTDVQITEMITIGAPETKDGTLANTAGEIIFANLDHSDVLAIGPGLSQNKKTQTLLKLILDNNTKPTVIDADGLNPHVIPAKGLFPLILTPHYGEAARLLNTTVEKVQADRENSARKIAIKYKAVVVLKGAPTFVTDGINLSAIETGNPGMATAGMGDVLTGAIVSLLGQGLHLWDAAISGVQLHGKAGNMVYEDKDIG
ncbi:MAG: NAD(P)H-hydrate dehydratase [Candidatus Margulisiibacteriota bacterium]|jgi:NAD(P)H-hydrate epimerase